jgi:lysophospholipase L1-like esterase
MRYMPVGDSLTLGTTGSPGNGGWRGAMMRNRLVDGLPYRSVGDLNNGGNNEWAMCGGSGKRTDDVLPMVQAQAPRFRPAMSTIHIGTNDATQRVGGGANPPTRAQSVQNVIDMVAALRGADPLHYALVAMIYPSSNGPNDAEFTAFNDELLTALWALPEYGTRVYEVDINAAIKAVANWDTTLFASGDSVHPNPAGFAVAAAKWRAMLDALGF